MSFDSAGGALDKVIRPPRRRGLRALDVGRVGAIGNGAGTNTSLVSTSDRFGIVIEKFEKFGTDDDEADDDDADALGVSGSLSISIGFDSVEVEVAEGLSVDDDDIEAEDDDVSIGAIGVGISFRFDMLTISSRELGNSA